MTHLRRRTVPELSAEVEVLCEGNLLKQGGIIKNWKERKFELTLSHLSYFEWQSSSFLGDDYVEFVKKGDISISDCFAVHVVDQSTVKVLGEDYFFLSLLFRSSV